MPRDSALPARIAAKFTVSEGCWLWTAGKQGDGYGSVWWDGQMRLAHRVVYELLAGPVPEGLQLDHVCRNRACVNPGHLEPTTSRENTLRGAGLAARHAAATHCLRGHEFTPENTGRRPAGDGRYCRACKRIRDAAFRAKAAA